MKHLLSNKSIALLALLLIGVLLYSLRPSGKSSINIGSVTRSDLIQRTTIAGIVNPNRKTIISAPYNGYVKKIYVQVGQKIGAGAPVVSVAQSLRNANEEVFPMLAPFPGTVVQVLRTEGEYVEQNSQTTSTLVRIDDLTRLYIEASSPEIEVGKLKVGQEVVIKALAVLDHPYKGKIQHISLAAKEQKDWDKSRVEFSVMIQVTDPDTQIGPGMSVIVDIITKKLPQVLTLRHEFIKKEKDKYFITTEDGIKKPIEVGTQNEEVFEILKGLNEGERIQQVDFLALLKEQ